MDECIEYPEHGSGTVVAFTAIDPEEEPVSWTLDTNSLVDNLFEIEGGRLTFITPPDFENARDSGTNNEYDVTVIASDGSPDSDDTTRSVKVTVTNVEEPGTIALSTVQPKEGVVLTATLTDPDTVTTNSVTWQWERSGRASGPWTDVDDEDTTDTVEGKGDSYTPITDDVGMYLRVTATYDDGHCAACDPKKMANAISVNSVEVEDYVNQNPVFKDAEGVEIGDGIERSVAENSPAGTAVGVPVTATDQAEFGPDVLTYSLGGGDADSFSIDRGTGQIRVGRGTAIDYEDSNNIDKQYAVTVTATDSSGATDPIDVTIKVTNVDESPTITEGRTAIDYPEIIDNSEPGQVGGNSNDYEATDPEDNPGKDDSPGALRWSLSGPDADKFTIGNGIGDRGKLNFKEAPDYEARSDANRDNHYSVTVEVTDRGRNKATQDVVVTVTNEEEAGAFTVSNRFARVDNKVTATLIDGDTPLSNISWIWQVGNTTVSPVLYIYPQDRGQ